METKEGGRAAAGGEEFRQQHLDRVRQLCKRLGLSINCIGVPPLTATRGSGLVLHTHVAQHEGFTNTHISFW